MRTRGAGSVPMCTRGAGSVPMVLDILVTFSLIDTKEIRRHFTMMENFAQMFVHP